MTSAEKKRSISTGVLSVNEKCAIKTAERLILLSVLKFTDMATDSVLSAMDPISAMIAPRKNSTAPSVI